MLHDLRFALRQFVHSPGFTAVAVLIVALGIGATTAMFSAVNALVLRPVPLPDSDRLMVLFETNPGRNITRFNVSAPNYHDWANQSRSWASLAAVTGRSMNLTGVGEAAIVSVLSMTASLLPTLGLSTQLGRGFSAEEDKPGHNQVAIVSHGFWQRRLGGRADVVNQSLLLDGASYTIVGVLPAAAFFPGDLEIAIPFVARPENDRRYEHELTVYGRLKHGVTIKQAEAEMQALAARLYAGFPDTDRDWRTGIVPLSQDIIGADVRTGLYVLLGAVALLLLIACANLANLLLVRTTARAHEIAIRTAMGASRWRVLRQFVTESCALTFAGGLLGVLLSLWAVGLLQSANLPRAAEISVDARVLLAAGLTIVLVGCFAGLGPALTASRTRPQEALKDRSRSLSHRSHLRDSMVVVQLALSLTLLIGGAMLVRSFWNLLRVDPGFATEHVLTVALNPGTQTGAVPFYERVTARVAALPEVAAVGLTSGLPLTGVNTYNNVFPVGPTPLPVGQSIQSSWRLTDGGYFGAMQIPLLRGHSFADLTPDEARRGIVLSASLAHLLFGDADPIGREIAQLRSDGPRLSVIGVVGDVRQDNLGTAAEPAFYWSVHRFLYGPMRLAVRTTGATEPLLRAIRGIVREIDPNVPVYRMQTMDELRRDSLGRERLITSLIVGFSVAALLLAALGAYGVVDFSVQQRTRELGIRIAVGAQAADILRLVVGQGIRLVTLAVLLGLAGAFAASRLLASILYTTGTADVLSYLVATIVLAATAMAASYPPARRATRVDPLVALHAE